MASWVRKCSQFFFCFLLFYDLQFFSRAKAAELIPALDAPSCLVAHPPLQMFLSFTIPYHTPGILSLSITYQGLYCHQSRQSAFCRKPPFAYQTVCTVNNTSTDDTMNAVKCNMTSVVRDLYPGLTDPSKTNKVQGSVLCLRVSASNQTWTTYSDKTCCNIVTDSAKCPKLENFQLSAKFPGQLQVTWECPLGIDRRMCRSLKYKIYYSAIGDRENKTVYPSISIVGSQSAVNLTGLLAYTQYRVLGGCSYVANMEDPTVGEFVQATEVTLEQAPSAAPVIVDYEETVIENAKRTVLLTWKHPPLHKRNGRIRRSLVKYWELANRASNQSNVTRITIAGATNWTLLQGLDTFVEYLVTVQACTNECGPTSDAYRILPNQVLSTPSASATHAPWVLPLFIVIALVLVACIVIVSVCLVFKRARIFRPRPQNRRPLPREVRPPLQSDRRITNDVATQPILEEGENEYQEAML